MTNHDQGANPDARPEDVLLRSLVEKVTEEAATHQYLRRRVDLLVWVAVAMLALASAGVVIRLVNYYGLRADVRSRDAEVSTLAKTSSDQSRRIDEQAHRINKLRAEVAIRDARFQASKGVLRTTGRLEDLLTIQQIVDRFALEDLRNGASAEKTSDDVRREVCDKLARAGYPCVP